MNDGRRLFAVTAKLKCPAGLIGTISFESNIPSDSFADDMTTTARNVHKKNCPHPVRPCADNELDIEVERIDPKEPIQRCIP